MRRPRWKLGLLCRWAGALVLVGGCGPQAQVRLDQPFAPPSQQRLELRGGPVLAADRGELCAYLLAFRRPGQRDGPDDFFLYVLAPSGVGTFAVGPGPSDVARGFLIQEVGQLRGKTSFCGGRVAVRALVVLPGRRELELELECADGTVVRGRGLIQESPAAVSRFERRKAADVSLLLPAEREPEPSAGSETPQRQAGAGW